MFVNDIFLKYFSGKLFSFPNRYILPGDWVSACRCCLPAGDLKIHRITDCWADFDETVPGDFMKCSKRNIADAVRRLR